jgi:hypothetical protein
MLVTRTTKTDRWAIAVNTSSEVVKDVSFNIASEVVDANLWGEWSTSSLISRSGPVPGEFLVPDESMFLTLNVFLLHTSQRCIAARRHPTGIDGADQTIFARSIALRPPERFFAGKSFRPSTKYSTLMRIGATINSVKGRISG